MERAKSLILKITSSDILLNEFMKSKNYLLCFYKSGKYLVDNYSQISYDVLLTIVDGLEERYVFLRLESETKRCYCTFSNGVALFERFLIKGLSKRTLRIFGPFDFWMGAFWPLDKKLYPRGSEILSALAVDWR